MTARAWNSLAKARKRAPTWCALMAILGPMAIGQTLFDPPSFVNGNAPYQWPDAPRGALVADFNADGWVDVVAGALQTNRLDVFFGDGQGGLGYGGTTIVPQPPTPPPCCPIDSQWPFAVADLDGNALPDLLCAVGD